MCRLFGFRSIINSKIHTSLVGAENALIQQSLDHPNGWGVAYYLADTPHLIKSLSTAIDDKLFRRVSGLVSSQTVLAHLRKATVGEETIVNTHPFQFGKWTFAHNGNIQNFQSCKNKLQKLIHPEFQPFILGETDSEIVFFVILSKMKQKGDIHLKDYSSNLIYESANSAVQDIISIVGELEKDDKGPADSNFLTFLISNGSNMLAYQGGKNLYYSTYKTLCSDRERCPSFSFECENKTKTGKVNHLIFSSEPIAGENIWLPMKFGEYISIDKDMMLLKK